MIAALGIFLTLASTAAPAPRQEKAAPRDPVNIGAEVDSALRWLRSVQDPESGSYGAGVSGTAWTLRALARSPRRYQRADGPFVARALDFLMARQRDDGAIVDPETPEAEWVERTREAALALSLFDDPDSTSVLFLTLGFLAEAETAPSDFGAELEALEPERASAEAARVLAERRDGKWDGPRGAVIETADAVIRLSALAQWTTPPRSEPKSPPRRLPRFDAAKREEVRDAQLRGARFLATVSDEGRFGADGHIDAGITAMVLAALQTVPEPRPEAIQRAVDSGLAWLLSLQREDGSIHDGKLRNYATSAAILALTRASRDEYAAAIARARRFLQILQADEGEGYSEGDLYYGGVGYGSDERPDLSNLQMALEALAASGLERGDPTFQKALAFLQRCQNRSESNDLALVAGGVTTKSGEDGGAGYAPGDSKAGFVDLADGTRVPRSYGSMTYALLKCLVLAGLPADDPRMEAAWAWCRENYTLDQNPGFEASRDPRAAYQGLYYYFYTMARALQAFGAEVLVDARGVEHAWRDELCGRLIVMQDRSQGSWVNENSPRWWEGNPVLATAYALLTLDAALPADPGDEDE